MKRTAALAAALAIMAAPATAAIYQVDFSFPTSGTPNPASGSVTIENGFDADFYVSEGGLVSTTIGLTLNSLNFTVDNSGFGDGVSFMYTFANDRLVIGGAPSGAGGISINTNDFLIRIDGFLTGTAATALGFLVQGAGFIAVDAPVNLTITEDPPVVPLPATLPLALAGLGLVGVLRLARRRPA